MQHIICRLRTIFNIDMTKILSYVNFFTSKSLFLRVCNASSLKTLWKGRNSSQRKWRKVFQNTVEKGEIAENEQFLLFQQSFPPLWKSPIFVKFKFIVCILFQFGRVYELPFGERVKG